MSKTPFEPTTPYTLTRQKANKSLGPISILKDPGSEDCDIINESAAMIGAFYHLKQNESAKDKGRYYSNITELLNKNKAQGYETFKKILETKIAITLGGEALSISVLEYTKSLEKIDGSDWSYILNCELRQPEVTLKNVLKPDPTIHGSVSSIRTFKTHTNNIL